MKTLIIITPHMSTGGCPQVVTKKVEQLKDFYNIIVIEWECVAWDYTVQRNKVISMIGEQFITLNENKEENLFELINNHNPSYIMIEEFSETFMTTEIMARLYDSDRNYKIFETTHSSHTKSEWKMFFPDKFIFVSPHSLTVFKELGVPMDLIEYPIETKQPNKIESAIKLELNPDYKHIVNIGLFTWGKNQGYAFEIARMLEKHKIMFHFIGNQAINFKDYWESIIENKPNNCVVWGERNDVDTFIQACDVHLFTSRLELNPISIKESLEYEKPTLIFNLDTYMSKYDNTENIYFLTGNLFDDCNTLLKSLNLTPFTELPQPKIRVVHLLLDPNKPKDIPLSVWHSKIKKQNKSILFWKLVKDRFYDYVQRRSEVNCEELPYENCKDSSMIDSSNGFESNFPFLSYKNYGAYKSHTEGILENFTEDIDALIIVEGDSYSNLSPEKFYNKILESYYLSKSIDNKIVTFAGICYMSGGDWYKMEKDYGEWVEVPHFLLSTTYMIMNSERENIINNIHNTGWHSPDFWLAWNYHNKSKILSTKHPIVYQK